MKMKIMNKRFAIVLYAVLLLFGLTACKTGNKEAAITIYDGQFSEMKIIHQMVKQLVEAKTEIKVNIEDEMAPVNSYNELVKGRCDIMNSYDGTLLTTYLKMDTSDVPEGTTLYDFANEQAMKKANVRLLDKLGTDNTYALAVPQNIANEYKLKTISDLIPVADQLVFGAEHEFFSEEGSMKFNPFSEFYNLKFKEAKPVDIGLKYSAVENGMMDVTVVYATDGLNKKAGLFILEDDQKYFPEYNGALLVRDNLFTEFDDVAPDLEDILNQLGGTMDNDMMTDMTYEVDVNGKTPAEVAETFLKEQGLIA